MIGLIKTGWPSFHLNRRQCPDGLWPPLILLCTPQVESIWNVLAHGDAREGKWKGNWRMEWVASTLHTTLELGVYSITTADAHTSAASSRLNWSPRRFKWTRPFRRKNEIWFLRVCHHISNAVYRQWTRVAYRFPARQTSEYCPVFR